MRRVHVLGAVLVASVAAGALAACEKIVTDPTVPVAIQLDSVPAIVAGDSLRDSLGATVPLPATAYDGKGNPIVGAPITFVVIDSLSHIAVDPATGKVAGVDTGTTRVVAQVNGLQSQVMPVTVVARPDLFASTTPTQQSTTLPSLHPDVRDTIAVKLTSAGAGVQSYPIEYRILYPAGIDNRDSTNFQLVVPGTSTPTLRAITDAGGAAALTLRISPLITTFNDSVVVEAAAFQPDRTPVTGSPQHFVIQVKIQ